jgi:hypothetical protein
LSGFDSTSFVRFRLLLLLALWSLWQRFFALSTNPQGLLRRRVEAGHAASLDGSASIRTPSLV